MNTAAPTIAAAFRYLGDEFLQLCTNQKLPGRLQRFSPAELQKEFCKALSIVSPVEGQSPTFA